MIGINKFGEIKSWVNENWAKNYPEEAMERRTLQTTKYISPTRLSSKIEEDDFPYSSFESKNSH